MERYLDKVIQIERFKTCFEGHYPGNYNFTGEFHPFWEIVYVLDGTVNVSGDERVYTLHKGDMIFHKPMEFHRIWSHRGNEIHVLIMSFRAEGQLMAQLENLVLSLDSERISQIDALISYMRENFCNAGNNFGREMKNNWNDKRGQIQVTLNLLENFLISLPKESMPAKKREKESIAETYKQIIQILNENVDGWITIDEIATECSFSPAQIKRVFAKYSDIGIHKYFLKLKIAAAIKMLGDGKDISEISRTLSFSSQNYFSGAFKRETGFSPTVYREKILRL